MRHPPAMLRPIPALLVLAVLSLASALHLGHHLIDPACDAPERGGPHPCVQCTGVHAAALAAEVVAAAPAPLRAAGTVMLPAWRAPRATEAIAGVPRAPPVS